MGPFGCGAAPPASRTNNWLYIQYNTPVRLCSCPTCRLTAPLRGRFFYAVGGHEKARPPRKMDGLAARRPRVALLRDSFERDVDADVVAHIGGVLAGVKFRTLDHGEGVGADR